MKLFFLVFSLDGRETRFYGQINFIRPFSDTWNLARGCSALVQLQRQNVTWTKSLPEQRLRAWSRLSAGFVHQLSHLGSILSTHLNVERENRLHKAAL